MIITPERNEVVKSGEIQESKFTIKASAQAFKILSDSIYSDKVGAVIRELSCNAWDAHVDAKKTDEAFVVHAPNYLEPWFSIRDYGYGISHEFMMNGYTVVFESTKNDTDEQIGGFGMGRLSAFSYTDSYSVVSIYKGVKRNYAAFKEQGLPAVTLLNEEKTDEPDGFEVSIAVDPKDFNDFHQKINRFFQYVDSPYKVTGMPFEISKKQILLQGKSGWRKCSEGKQSYAKMGLVWYPINNYSVNHPLLNSGLVIDFAIGELEITPSREALSYTASTIQRIKDKFPVIQKEIQEVFQAKLDSAATIWDAKLMFSEFGSDDLYGSLFSFCENALSYKGDKMTKFFAFTTGGLECYRYQKHWSRKQVYSSDSTYVGDSRKLYVSDEFEYCYDDDPPKKGLILKEYFGTVSHPKKLYLLKGDIAELDKVLEGHPPFKKLSEYPYTPPERRERRKNPLAGLRVLELSGLQWKSPGEFDWVDKQYFVSCPKKDAKYLLPTLMSRTDDLKFLKKDIPRVFWIPECSVKKVSHWEQFIPWAEKEVKDWIDLIVSTIVIQELPEDKDFLFKLKKFYSFGETIPVSLQNLVDSMKKVLDNLPNPSIVNFVESRGQTIPRDKTLQDVANKFFDENPFLKVIKDHVFGTIPEEHEKIIKSLIK